MNGGDTKNNKTELGKKNEWVFNTQRKNNSLYVCEVAIINYVKYTPGRQY